jgi:hypothetical protein
MSTTKVQFNIAVGTNTKSTEVVLTRTAVQQGDSLVACVGWDNPSATIISIADNYGNIYQPIATASLPQPMAVYGCLSAVPPATAGLDLALTVTFSAACDPVLGLYDLTGAPFANQYDSIDQATFGSSSETLTPSLTMAVNYWYEILIGFVGTLSASTLQSANSGWTLDGSSGRFSFFSQSNVSTTGATVISPSTLGTLDQSTLIAVGSASPIVPINGVIIAPRFPDAFETRIGDESYDSISGDPSYVADNYGPRPYLRTQLP